MVTEDCTSTVSVALGGALQMATASGRILKSKVLSARPYQRKSLKLEQMGNQAVNNFALKNPSSWELLPR